MVLSLEIMPAEEPAPAPPIPAAVVARYGYLRTLGEFSNSQVNATVRCGTPLVVRTPRGTEVASLLIGLETANEGGQGLDRAGLQEYIRASGGASFPITWNGRVLRVATRQDLARQRSLEEVKPQHLNLARALAKEHGLAVKILEVEPLLGLERVTFYFTSAQRVDFRSLVRALAQQLHTRVELRQVGPRDAARLTADYDRCGLSCCCQQFLKVLAPVSLRAARLQQAPTDPAQNSGRCGRLRCCLRYEQAAYEALRGSLSAARPRTPGCARLGEVVHLGGLTATETQRGYDGGCSVIAAGS